VVNYDRSRLAVGWRLGILWYRGGFAFATHRFRRAELAHFRAYAGPSRRDYRPHGRHDPAAPFRGIAPDLVQGPRPKSPSLPSPEPSHRAHRLSLIKAPSQGDRSGQRISLQGRCRSSARRRLEHPASGQLSRKPLCLQRFIVHELARRARVADSRCVPTAQFARALRSSGATERARVPIISTESGTTGHAGLRPIEHLLSPRSRDFRAYKVRKTIARPEMEQEISAALGRDNRAAFVPQSSADHARTCLLSIFMRPRAGLPTEPDV